VRSSDSDSSRNWKTDFLNSWRVHPLTAADAGGDQSGEAGSGKIRVVDHLTATPKDGVIVTDIVLRSAEELNVLNPSGLKPDQSYMLLIQLEPCDGGQEVGLRHMVTAPVHVTDE